MAAAAGESEASGFTRCSFTCVPHHHAMTKAGDATLSNFKDALAEFIDNSIEATWKAGEAGLLSEGEERRVEINVFCDSLNAGSAATIPPSYLTIADNGCGMTQSELVEFSTFALNKLERNQKILAENTSCIGKFGVGSKQSGYWLGDRIRVICKGAPAPPAQEDEEAAIVEVDDGTDCIYEVTHDCVEMDRKAAVAKDEVYKNEIVIRPRGKSNHDGVPKDEAANKSLMELIEKHERENKYFTIFIIKLKREKAEEFFKETSTRCNFYQYPTELAQIYHFHLHPEHTPAKICDLPKFDYRKKTKEQQSFDRVMYPTAPKVSGQRGEKPKKVVPLNIIFSIFQKKKGALEWKGVKDYTNLSLRDVRDAVTQHFEKAAACFRFSMQIPKPDPPTMSTSQAIKNLEIDDRANAGNMAEVQGLVFYFPYSQGSETRPLPSYHDNSWYEPPQSKIESSSSVSPPKSHTKSPKGSKAGQPEEAEEDEVIIVGDNDDEEGGDAQVDDDDGDDDEAVQEAADGSSSKRRSLSRSRGSGVRKSDEDDDASMDLDEPEVHRRVVTPDRSELMSATERNELLKRPEQSLFDVYWSERLLPQSHANTIAKLFPNITTIGECEKHELPENWRQRLKGYLFFDNSWHAVTNNKLALRIPQYDLDTYFAPAHIANDISIDKTTKENFRKFLQNCHKHFDREFTCKERMRHFESVVQGGRHAAGTLALFRKAVWGGDVGIEVKAGDVVKIFLTSTGKRTSSASGKKAVLGKIVCFSVVNQTTSKQEQFLGAPVVHYLRIPTVDYHGEEGAFFKDGNPEEPTEAAFNANEPCSIQAIFHPKINYAVEKTKGKSSSIFATEKEVAAVRSQGLHKISLCLFETKGGRPISVLDSMTFQPNNRFFYKFGVQLLNKSDSPIISPPAPHVMSNKSKFDNFFRVRTMYMPNGVRTGEKTERDLWVYNASEDKDERKIPCSNLNLANAYYTTYGLRNGLDSQDIELKYGENRYKVEVLDSRDRVVMKKEFVLKVQSSLVHSWKVELLDHNPRTMTTYLPRMRLTLLDKHKEIARDACCKIKVAISFGFKPTAGGKDDSDGGVVSKKKKQKQGRRGADEMEIEDKADEPEPEVFPVRCFCFSHPGEPTDPLGYVSTECIFEIEPNDRGELLMGPVEEGHAEYRIDMESNGRVFQVRGCEPGGLWSPDFPTDGSFSEAPNFLRDGKVTQFTMVVSLEEGGKTEDSKFGKDRKFGKDHVQVFRVEYHSTHKIAELRRVTAGATRSGKEDGDVCVMQGDSIPELIFQCYDRFGMKVAPGFRDVTRKWKFRVDSPYVEGDIEAEANPQGEVVFRHLRIKEDLGDAEAPKITGLPVDILVTLVVNENERLREPWTAAHMDELGFNTDNLKCIWEPKETLLDFLEDGFNVVPSKEPKKVLKAYRKFSEKVAPPHLKIPIVVMPRCKPTFIKVFFDGREVDVAELDSLTVGTELSNLTLRLYDSNNEQIPFEKSWFPAKKKNLIDVSWDQNFKSFKWSESSPLELKLPDITSDMTSAPGAYDMHVILHIFESLEFEFEINVLAGEPTRWGLLASADCENEGVRCDDPEDFASKILAVVLTDQDGYTVPRSAMANDLQPIIQVFDRDPSRIIEEESDGGDATSKKKKKQKQGRHVAEEMETEENGSVEEVIDDDDDDDDGDDDDDDDDNENETNGEDDGESSTRKRKRTVRVPSQNKIERIMPTPMETLEASLYVPSKSCLSGGVVDIGRGGGSQGRQVGCFYFSSATDLPYPVVPIGDEPERYIWIVVKDKEQRLKPFIKKIEITHGLPVSMQVRCKAFCISDWTATDAVAKINRQATNTVFEVKLLDKHGKPAVTYPNSKKMKNFEVKVFSPGKPGVETLKRSFSAPGEFFTKSLNIKGVLKALSAMAPGAPAAEAAALTSTDPSVGKKSRGRPRKGQTPDDDAMCVDGSTAAAAEADEACEFKVVCSYKFRDVEQKLTPILLKCETSQLNNVTSMRIAADAPSDKLVVPCDESPGNLVLTLVTDDGVPLSASELLKTIDARLGKELFYSEKQAGANNKRKMCAYGDYFYFPTVDAERRAIIIRGQTQETSEVRDWQALWKVGFYTLVLQYKELREFEGFEGVVFPDVSETLNFQVVPGRVHSLYPDQKSYQKLSNCSATTIGDNRIITNGVYIFGRDCWGNQTNLPDGTTVSCKIRRSITSMLTQEVESENSHPSNTGHTQGSIPRLKGADAEGFLSSTVTSQGRAAFDLELEEGTGSSPGIMELVFDFVDASFDHPVKQHVATFKFTTDAKRIKAEKNLRAVLQDLEERMTEYDNRRQEFDTAKETAKSNIIRQLELSKSFYLSNFRNMARDSGPEGIGTEDIKKQKKEIATTIKDREKAAFRPAKIDATEQRALERQVKLANEHEVETYGHIIDLGYVEDEEDAVIMSQIAANHMHMLVVPDREKCYELAKVKDSQGKPPSVWPLADCPRFQYRAPDSSFKNRSEEDRKKKKLPARELRATNGEPIPGKPRALVNLVQLADEHEDLRETVFDSIFGSMVIFDDIESALKYKQRTLKAFPQRSFPTLWAKKEGQKVASDGRIDGRNAIKASDASRLKFVFGSLPSSKNAEFSGLQHDLTVCDNLIQEIKHRDAAEAEIRALPRDEVEELRQRIASVKCELDELLKSDSD